MASPAPPVPCMTMGTAATMMSLAETLGFVPARRLQHPGSGSGHAQLSPRPPAGVSSPRLGRFEALRHRAAVENAITVDLASPGRPIRSFYSSPWRAVPASPSTSKPSTASPPACRFWPTSGRPGAFSWKTFTTPAACAACTPGCGIFSISGAPASTAGPWGEHRSAAVYLDEVIVPTNPVGIGAWPCCAATSPRGAVIAAGGGEGAARPYRAGGGVRDYNDMERRIDDPALPVTADSVLVLRDAGPVGAPGMPEWGQLLSQEAPRPGVRDMVPDLRCPHVGHLLRCLRPASRRNRGSAVPWPSSATAT